MNRTGIVVLVFIGVFLAGAISGGFVGARFSEDYMHRRAAELFAQQQFKRLSDHLGLTPEQRQRIQPIVTKAGKEIQEQRREISSIAEKMEAEVRRELTEEQRKQFDVVRSRMRDNERVFQRWVREQRARRQEQALNPNSDGPAPVPLPEKAAPEKSGEK